MRAGLILLGLTLPLTVTAGDKEKVTPPPPGWIEFSPRDKSFSVWLPDKGGKRSERERTMNVRTMRLKINIIQLEMNGGPTYNAGTVILPLALARKIPNQERIEIFRDAFVKEVTGKIDKEKEITLGPVKGREYQITTGRGPAVLRLFSAGSRIYRLMVIGSKDQVEGKDAETFLNSYKLPTALAAKTNVPQGTALVIPGDTFAFLQTAVKDNRLADVGVRGRLDKESYRDCPAYGGLLIGFQVGAERLVDALRPIYMTKDGEKMGDWIGKPPAKPITIKAKEGYVVGGINLKAGLSIDGLSLKFVKLDKGQLQVTDNYTSDWVGGQGGNRADIDGQGAFFVGVCGNLRRGTPVSVGLITVLQAK
jgi:hypothetical protein